MYLRQLVRIKTRNGGGYGRFSQQLPIYYSNLDAITNIAHLQ